MLRYAVMYIHRRHVPHTHTHTHTHTHCEIPLITLRVVTERVDFFMFMLKQKNSEIDRRRRPLSRRVNFLS